MHLFGLHSSYFANDARSQEPKEKCVSIELAFQIIGNIYPLLVWKIFRMGMIDAAWKIGLSDALGITHECDPLAHFPACPLNCQVSLWKFTSNKTNERWGTGWQLLGNRLRFCQIDPYVLQRSNFKQKYYFHKQTAFKWGVHLRSVLSYEQGVSNWVRPSSLFQNVIKGVFRQANKFLGFIEWKLFVCYLIWKAGTKGAWYLWIINIKVAECHTSGSQSFEVINKIFGIFFHLWSRVCWTYWKVRNDKFMQNMEEVYYINLVTS